MAEAEPEGPRRPRRRRWPWIALGLLALLVAARAAAPWAIARLLEREFPRAVGLNLRVANVDLGLLRGTLALEGVELERRDTGAGPGAPLLRLGRLAAELAYSDLFEGRVRLRELALEQPVLRFLRLADGSLEDPLPPRPAEPAEVAGDEGPGWPVQVERLRVAGLDLELADPGRGAPALGFSLEELELEALAVAGGDITLGGVGVRGPRLRVERSFVFPPPAAAAEPAAPAPGSPAPPAPEAAGPAPRYRLERVAVERAGISLLSEGEPLDVELDLTAEGVSAQPGETFPFALGLRIEDGEVRAEGRAGLAPPRFDGTLRWHDLAFPLFVVAARPDLAPWIRSCRADGELEVALRVPAGPQPETPPGVRLSGRFAVRDLAVGDPKQREVELAWQGLEVGVEEAFVPFAPGSTPMRVALGQVKLEAPKLQYTRPSPELDALLRGAPAEAGAEDASGAEAPAAPAPAAAEPGVAPIELRVASFELTKGTLRYGDGTLAAPFRTAVRDLSVRARDVRWPGPVVGDLRVRGVAPERAPFSLAGKARGASGEFAFEIQGLDLPAFDPYAARAGYHLARGSASLRSSVRIEPARYVSQNDLELHDLRLDAAESGAFERQFGTSLDLALALLRTPSGDIKLPVPLTVERENLRVGLGTVVLGAVRSALLGVVSSPLKALGAALPGGGEGEVDASALAAAPGSPDLLPGESARVKALRKLLRTRPLLAATLTGQAGPSDREALALALLRERAVSGESLPEVQGGGFFASRRVAEALREGSEDALEDEDAALFERLRAAAEVPPERFSDLARRRAEALRERLVTGKRPVEAARVSVAEPAEGEPGVDLELVARSEEVASP